MEMNSSNNDSPSSDIAFTIQLCNYFNCEGTLEVLLDKISQIKEQKESPKLKEPLCN